MAKQLAFSNFATDIQCSRTLVRFVNAVEGIVLSPADEAFLDGAKRLPKREFDNALLQYVKAQRG